MSWLLSCHFVLGMRSTQNSPPEVGTIGMHMLEWLPESPDEGVAMEKSTWKIHTRQVMHLPG